MVDTISLDIIFRTLMVFTLSLPLENKKMFVFAKAILMKNERMLLGCTSSSDTILNLNEVYALITGYFLTVITFFT